MGAIASTVIIINVSIFQFCSNKKICFDFTARLPDEQKCAHCPPGTQCNSLTGACINGKTLFAFLLSVNICLLNKKFGKDKKTVL